MLLYMKCVCEADSRSLDYVLEKKEDQVYVPAGVLYHISKRPEGINGLDPQIKRNGILLDDKEILTVMEPEGKGKYIPYKVSARSNNSLYSKENFDDLLDSVGNTVKRVAEEMKKGICNIAPMKTSAHDGCKYCKMLPICRYKESDSQNNSED